MNKYEEKIEVIPEAFVCMKCQHEMMDTKQMSEFRILAANKYREKNNLLTSDKIIAFRKSLGMSQMEFSKYLGVGDASIKRWETYHIQEDSQDELIRLKCDKFYAIENMLNIEWKSTPADEYSGNKKFNINIFGNLVLHLLSVTKSPLYLNKALFYIDFKNYKQNGKGISGARYVALDYGPCPDKFKEIYRYMEDHGLISRSGKHDLKSLKNPDLSVFDDRELETIRTIVDYAKKDGGVYFFELSLKESAFTETTKYIDYISYSKALNLLI